MSIGSFSSYACVRVPQDLEHYMRPFHRILPIPAGYGLARSVVLRQREYSDSFLVSKFRSTPSNTHHFTRFKKQRIVFISGVLDSYPTQRACDLLSNSAELGLAIITTSHETHYLTRGRTTLLGGTRGYMRGDWRDELSTVFARLYVDNEMIKRRDLAPNGLILIGHSMGAFLLHGLLAYHRAWQLGKWRHLDQHFPGMEKLPHEIVESVLSTLDHSVSISLGNNLVGTNNLTQFISKETGLSRITDEFFSFNGERFLKDHYTKVDLQPNDPEYGIDGVITTQPFDAQSLLSAKVFLRESSRSIKSAFAPHYEYAKLFLDLQSRIMPMLGYSSQNDGLVDNNLKRRFPNEKHIVGFNHIEQLEAQFMPYLLEFLRSIPATNMF